MDATIHSGLNRQTQTGQGIQRFGGGLAQSMRIGGAMCQLPLGYARDTPSFGSKMVDFLTPYQIWLLAAKKAINERKYAPIPLGSPPMTKAQRDAWQRHVWETIYAADKVPLTPLQWLQEQEKNKKTP